MNLFICAAVALGLVLCPMVTATADVVVLDDSLRGSTSGRAVAPSTPGAVQSDGWLITDRHDSLFWHLPHIVYSGAAEFKVTGLRPDEDRPGLTDKSGLFTMYDYTYGGYDAANDLGAADYVYGCWRDTPFKFFVNKTGTDGAYNNSINALEIGLGIPKKFEEPNSRNLDWNPGTEYLIRVEWGPDPGRAGNCRYQIFRDGELLTTISEPGSWSPFGHSVRIGAPRVNEWAGAPLDAKFRDLKVWDRETELPVAPVLTAPGLGKSVKTTTPRIQWAWTPTFNRYQVRITTGNSPDIGIAWDSGQVKSVKNFAEVPIAQPLNNSTNYYAWVKLGNVVGWTNWTPSGQWFRVNTSYTPPNNGTVHIVGNSLQDNSGPFLALGFTYMEGLGFCKHDRDRFRSDLAFMSSRGFNSMRILSEVPAACDRDWWYGREINASSYTCGHPGDPIPWAVEWADYDQQFRDMVDIAYDEYGIRTEVTIFGGAGMSFPTYAGRQAHCQRILNLLVGREHKVSYLEVANEAWQTGFDYPQGITDLRSLVQYIKSRTTLPCASSATPWGMYPWDANQALVELYCGSAADIGTEHFERDIDTFEGGWLPVRDCWRVENVGCLPPMSSDEPIGPGSSVNSETDPIRLVSAACFAWTAKLYGYVFHTDSGVRGDYRFEDNAGVNDFKYVRTLLPADLPNWTRNDGLEASAPFTAYCNGQANKYWTDFGTQNLPDGCHRNIGGRKGSQFVCYPQGILAGGLTLQARQKCDFYVFNPMTGALVDTVSLPAGQDYFRAQGPGAYIIRGIVGWDYTAPSPDLKFTANPGDGQNVLTWRNPSDADFCGTKIVFRTDRYPTSVADGTLLCDRPSMPDGSDQYTHGALTNGLRYYYAAFAYDANIVPGPNYSSRATAAGRPTAGQCFSERFTYANGNLSGNREWSGSATSEIQILSDAVKFNGGNVNKTVVQPVSCYGSVIQAHVRIKSGSGANNLWSIWFNDPNGNNLARWYGNGTLARPRIGATGLVLDPITLTGGWDDLEVRINTAANTTEFYFNGAYRGSLNHSSTGAGDSVGSIMLERMESSQAGYYIYLDDVVIGPAALDNTPPGPVTDFVATKAGSQVNLSWTKPTDPDLAGIKIIYKTSGTPTDWSDGTLVYDGSGTSCAHTSIPGGVLSYAAYAYDGLMNYSTAATASVIVDLTCFSDAFTYSNGSLNGKGGWTGSATSQVAVESEAVKISGGAGLYNAAQAVTCNSSPVVVRAKVKRGSGTSTIWNVYMFDASGGDLGRWYGSGTSGRGRVGLGTPTGVGTLTGGWDDLYAKIDLAAHTTQFIFNGVVLGTPTHTGADGIGSIRIERPDSSTAASQYVYLDDISVGSADVTAPAATIGVPSVSVTRTGPISFPVSFGEPVFGLTSPSDIQVNASGNAAATVSVSGSGAAYTVTLSNITGSGTLGITVKASACTDVAANANSVSAASTTVTVVASDGSIRSAKQLANGTHVELCGKALYLDGSSYGYIEEQNRSAGMRIEGTVTANAGDLVCLSGAVQTTSGGEKYIQIDAIAATGQATLRAVGCSNRAVKSGLMDGLRLKTWGTVKPGSITGNSYVITDGSDDTGVKVITADAPGVSANQFVTVVGAAGIDGVRVIYKE